MTDGKVSRVEEIKAQSGHLRGDIAEELGSDSTHFTEESVQVLKFHGMYQQDDRDVRAQLKREGKEKAYSMMIRARVPGGVLTPEAYLQFDRIADVYGNGTLRITTRQTFQVHGILKKDVKATVQSLHETLITTLGGCGDQVRNMLMCPAPRAGAFHDELRRQLLTLVDALSAKTNAYHEIWLDGEKVEYLEEPSEEPLYGQTYLPRKFKLAFAIEGDNCVDIYANDLGMVAHRDGDRVAGYTLLVGGGMGRTAAKDDTYPRLASPIAFVTPEQLVETATAVVAIQRDFGNRVDRRRSRFKYLLDERGLPWFQEELERRLGRPLRSPRRLTWESTSDHLGWREQGDGRYCLGIYVQNGRVRDTDALRLKAVLRSLVSEYRPSVRLTAGQNMLLGDLSGDVRMAVEHRLRAAGVRLLDELAPTVRYAMACPALPTCGLATAESERVLPGLLTEIGQALQRFGLSAEPISIRMTGCANGCARPYIADIGLVGRTLGKYDIFLGGDFLGARLNARYEELVPMELIVSRLSPLLAGFKRERNPGERFGDYCHRVGLDHLRQIAATHARGAFGG
ncbi:MAG: NADPH-dependent assimilatory sulfite reductase hemoprotein subunit [Bacilli bacterium]